MLIIFIVLIIFYIIFRKLSGENERIKVFLRIYLSAKNKFPEASERELLGVVIGEHILPGKTIRLRDSGMTGMSYLNGVFGDKELTINEIIYHAITLEFPHKYKPFELNLDDIRKINRGQKVDLKHQLRNNIEKYKAKLEKG